MTIIVGLMCSDGAILASDSQATDIDAATRVEVESKLFRLGTHIVWGVSGPEGLRQVLQESLEAAYRNTWPNRTLSQVRMTIVNKVAGRQNEALRQFTQVKQNDAPPSAEVLFCGHTGDRWLLEVAHNGQQQQHYKFCAIGSGKATAYRVWTTLKHYAPHDESTEFGKLLAYRIVYDVIQADLAFVGFPIRMWTIRQSGANHLTEAEVDTLGQIVEKWKEEERRSLRRVLEGKGPSTEV